MATNEAEFKSEFKKDVESEYPGAHIWTSTDLLRSGLPDFYVLWGGLFVAVEAKFITKLLKKKSSLVLSHVVSPSQQSFLRDTQRNKQKGIVLIGSSHAAIVMEDIKENYTLEECLNAPRIRKENGVWQVKGLLNEWKQQVLL